MWLCIYDISVLTSVCLLSPGGAMHAMYCYSPLSDSWSLVTRLGERASCAIAACNNKLFITGGRDNKNQVISTVMCWDVDRGVLTEECVLPMGVSHHGSVTLMKSYTHIHRITPASECQWHKLTWTRPADSGVLVHESESFFKWSFFMCITLQHVHSVATKHLILQNFIFTWCVSFLFRYCFSFFSYVLIAKKLNVLQSHTGTFNSVLTKKLHK